MMPRLRLFSIWLNHLERWRLCSLTFPRVGIP